MRVKAVLLIAVAVAASLAACTPDRPGTPGAAGASAGNPSSAAPGAPATGRDGCLTGTWKVDVNDLAQQTAAKLGSGATGSGSGTITLDFGDQMTIKYNNVITINSPLSAGLTMVMKNTFTGDATSTDWRATDGKLAGTMPANTVKSTIVATVGGRAAPPMTTPFSGALDMSAGALGYTCSGNAATFTTPMVTWHLTKV